MPLPQRHWAILTIALGLIMAVMDGAIANNAGIFNVTGTLTGNSTFTPR